MHSTTTVCAMPSDARAGEQPRSSVIQVREKKSLACLASWAWQRIGGPELVLGLATCDLRPAPAKGGKYFEILHGAEVARVNTRMTGLVLD